MECSNASFNGNIVTKQYLIGEIIMWPNSSSIPTNFLSCDGSPRNGSSSSDYNDLYTVIGTKFGEGNGDVDSFSLPNLNFNSTDDFSLIKGGNMSNINNTISDIGSTGGNNKINTTIGHSHSLTYDGNSFNKNIVHNINKNSNFNNIKRANTTDENNQQQFTGNHNTRIVLENHTHNINYSEINTNKNSNVTMTTTALSNNLNNSNNNHTTYIPKSLKIHYIICYKQN